MSSSAPTVLLFTTAPEAEAHGWMAAAGRAGVGLRLVEEGGDESGASSRGGTVAAHFARDQRHVDDLLRALDDLPVDGVLVTAPRAAWLAAHVARARGLAWHAPEAVVLSTDRLLTRGRLLAADLPTPWFVGLPVSGDDELDRLARAPMPCVVAVSDTTLASDVMRAETWDSLIRARAAFATALGPATDAMLIVEGLVPGRGFVLDGVLEQGALRVFALFEEIQAEAAPRWLQASVHVTPARMAPADQHVVAGHVARAALALGLHHGPVHATCRVVDDTVVVLGVAPHPPSALLARALPVVAPDRVRCTYEDALLAHALGHSLDHYGHQALASGLLTLEVEDAARMAAVEGHEAVAEMPWVTEVEVVPPGDRREPVPGGGSRAAMVYAQGAQPDDVVATLEAAARRLRIAREPAVAGAPH